MVADILARVRGYAPQLAANPRYVAFLHAQPAARLAMLHQRTLGALRARPVIRYQAKKTGPIRSRAAPA